MKVLHLCTKVPFPAKDGGSLAILSFISLSKRSNISVTLLAANTPKHKVNNLNNSLQGVELHSVPVNTNIKLPALLFNFLFSEIPYNFVRFRNHKFKKNLKDLFHKEQFDIIQLEGPHMGIYLPLIRKYSKAKIVLRAHNVEYLLWKDIALETKSKLKRFYFESLSNRIKTFESNLINKVDGIIPISNHDLRKIMQFSAPKKHVVIPFGLSPDNYSPSNNSQKNTIFYIGALDWIPNQKGLIWFLDNVWPKTKNELPHVTFHVAGRNAPSWLKDRLISENVNFYGEVIDAKAFMNRFRIMVIPLFSGSGVRIKILEAMALKKAIITTPKGAEGINITPGKEVIIADEQDTFSAKIFELVHDNIKQNSLGEAARAFISKEFDNLALANKVKEFYRMVSSV